MNNCSHIVITYLANSDVPIKSTSQVVRHVYGGQRVSSNFKVYRHVFRTLLKLEREKKIASIALDNRVGRFWYHPARFNEPWSGQENAS